MDVMDIARFWSKVDVKREKDCWEWRGGLTASGYGEFKLEGFAEQAHRVAYRMASGTSPEVVRHHCDNPKCVNPKHLTGGTHADNVRDRMIRGRTAVGMKNGRRKLTEAQVIEIRKWGFAPIHSLAKRYGVGHKTIEAVRYGKSWKHLLPTSIDSAPAPEGH